MGDRAENILALFRSSHVEMKKYENDLKLKSIIEQFTAAKWEEKVGTKEDFSDKQFNSRQGKPTVNVLKTKIAGYANERDYTVCLKNINTIFR